jgi:hypothetical protein
MQLLAYGAQDVYLTGSPEINFFKLVYRRHTNFAIESIEQVFNGSPGFGKKASTTISRNGDLITQIFLQITAPSLESLQPGTFSGNMKKGWVRYTNSFAHALVESCEIEIGGQRIDKHYSAYYEVMDELACPECKRSGYGKMIGKMSTDDEMAPYDESEDFTDDLHMGSAGDITFYLPLRFWFNQNYGLALPLLSLQYHEVKLYFSFLPFSKLINWKFLSTVDPSSNGAFFFNDMNLSSDKKKIPNLDTFSEDVKVSLYVDYVYLDTEERRLFTQVSHEYLIEQLQFKGAESYTLSTSGQIVEKVRLNFNHPCKELIFCVQSENCIAANKHFDFGENVQQWNLLNETNRVPTILGYDYIDTVKLQLNGYDRFSARKGSYFRLVVPFQCHTRIPTRHVYCYSFALRPEEHQPSGSCNFSRIDNASLHLTFASSPVIEADSDLRYQKKHMKVKLNVFAVSYNVLRIMSGMGGLAYAN